MSYFWQQVLQSCHPDDAYHLRHWEMLQNVRLKLQCGSKPVLLAVQLQICPLRVMEPSHRRALAAITRERNGTCVQVARSRSSSRPDG
jgi:hypothetical protein